MVAQATGLARIAIDEGEAKMLAEAGSNVAQFYDMPAMAPETLAWCGLIQAAAMVYGSRILAARAEVKAAAAERAAGRQPQGATPQPAQAAQQKPPAPAMVKTIVGGVEYDVPAPGTVN